MARRLGTLAAVRGTPEVILWALGVFLAGVVLLPMAHAVGHRGSEHVHGPLAELFHAKGKAHGGHGEGSLAHLGAALIESEAPALLPAAEAMVLAEVATPTAPPVARWWLSPLRAQAP